MDKWPRRQNAGNQCCKTEYFKKVVKKWRQPNRPLIQHWKSESEIEVSQLCPPLCDPMDCGPPGSSVHWILQARILEWVVISFSRGSSQPKDQTQVSRTAGRLFTVWATGDSLTLYACIILTTPVSSDSRAGLGISYDTDGVAGGLYFLYSSLWSIESHFLVLYKIGWVSFFF